MMISNKPVSAGRRRSQRGNAGMEAGLCLSIFLMLFVTIMDYSRWAYINNLVPYLAREGTRYASVHGSTSSSPASATDIQNYVQAKAVGIPSTDLNVAVTFSGTPGTKASVTVTGYFTPLTPWLLAAGSRTGSSASSNMTILQ